MSTEPPNKTNRLSGWLHALAVMVLLVGGSDISEPVGSRARQLQLPFAWAAYLAPFLAVGAYIAVGQVLSRTKLGRLAWVGAFVAGVSLLDVPRLVEATYAQPIVLTRWLEPGEKTELSARFPHPYVHYSATSQGIRLLIRRSDFDPSLLEFLRSIHVIPIHNQSASADRGTTLRLQSGSQRPHLRQGYVGQVAAAEL